MRPTATFYKTLFNMAVAYLMEYYVPGARIKKASQIINISVRPAMFTTGILLAELKNTVM